MYPPFRRPGVLWDFVIWGMLFTWWQDCSTKSTCFKLCPWYISVFFYWSKSYRWCGHLPQSDADEGEQVQTSFHAQCKSFLDTMLEVDKAMLCLKLISFVTCVRKVRCHCILRSPGLLAWDIDSILKNYLRPSSSKVPFKLHDLKNLLLCDCRSCVQSTRRA